MDPRATAVQFSRLPGKQFASERSELSRSFDEWVSRGGFLPSVKRGNVDIRIVALKSIGGFPYFFLADRSKVLAVGETVV